MPTLSTETIVSTLGRLRLIDLSVALEHNAPGEFTPPKIRYPDHEAAGLLRAASEPESDPSS
jgi:hypothetical protein